MRARTTVLFAASVLFSLLLGWQNTLLMLSCVAVDYLLSGPVYEGGRGDKKAHALLIFCAVKNIMVFVVCSSLEHLGLRAMPLGVTVYCFTSLGYMIDLYNGEADRASNPLEFGLFCCFFGKLYVGPIVSSGSFLPQLRRVKFSAAGVSAGADWLIHGLAKYVILALGTGALAAQFSAIPYSEKTVLSVWMLIVCNILSVYFTLSGFSDMARGLGALFGLDLPENFHYPLQSDSVTDFFSRFNISANRFVRKYVYGALGAEDNGPLSTTLNIMLITMLMGIWYGVSLNKLAWGASLGVLIVLETLFGERFFDRLPALIRRLYTFVAVVFSFSWYCGTSLRQTIFYLSTMFGLGGASAYSDSCLYLILSNWLLLAMGVLFCTNAFNYLSRYMRQRFPAAARFVGSAGNFGLLLLTAAFLV